MHIVTILFFFLCTISYSFAQGDLSATLKGQQNSTKLTVGTIEIPNNLATKTGSIAALIETGNNNILANPSFEHSTYSTSWTLGGTGTYSAETSTLIHGKKALKVVTSSQTVSLTQDSTLYQAQFADSVQCEASVKIKTDSTVAPVICARQAGTTSTVDCVTAANDNKWATYTIPFICKGTSNGIAIDIASATGTTYIDDAYVGVPKNLSTSSAVGNWVTGTCTSTHTTNATTTCRYRSNGDSIDIEAVVSYTGATDAANLTFSLPSGFTLNTSKIETTSSPRGAVIYLDNSTSTAYSGAIYLQNTSSPLRVFINRDLVNSGTSYVSIVAMTNTVPVNAIASGDFVKITAMGIPVNELNGNVTTYSAPTNVNNENVFSAYVTSAGVTTSENVDWISGDFSKASSRYTASLVNTYGTGMACTCSGTLSNGDINCTVTASATQIIVDMETDGVATDNAFQVVCQKQSTDYQASRSIVGSFKDNVISKDSGQLNVRVGWVTCSSSSSIGGQIGSWISSIGNVSAGACSVTVSGFLSTPYCQVTWYNSAISTGLIVTGAASSTTNINIDCEDDAGTACTSYPAMIVCYEDL